MDIATTIIRLYKYGISNVSIFQPVIIVGSSNQQRSQTCKKCRKTFKVKVKNHTIVEVKK